MFLKKFLFVILTLAAILGAFFYFFLGEDKSPQKSSYESLKQTFPSFENDFNNLTSTGEFQKLGLLAENLIPKAKAGYEKAYLMYVAAYSYTNAVIQNDKDTESLEKAIAFSRELIFDEDQFPIFRAYALDSYDRLLFSFMDGSIRTRAMSESGFVQYTDSVDSKNIRFFRRNLLTDAITLYPVTNAHFKLALISAQELTQYRTTATGDSTEEQLGIAFLDHMKKGDELLKRDYANQGLFGNTTHVPESLLSRTLAAQVYFMKTGEAPYGNISNLYRQVIEESNRLNPSYTHNIEYWQSLWLKESGK